MSDERDARIKHTTRVIEDIVDNGYAPIEMRISSDVETKSAVLTITFLQIPDAATIEQYQELAAAYWAAKRDTEEGAS
jgi:hypothetical protein